MSIEGFLVECNHPKGLLAEYRSDDNPITQQTLEQMDFIKPIYSLHDLSVLRERFFFVDPSVPAGLSFDKQPKDLRHLHEISKLSGKKLVKTFRKELGMTFPNRGFISQSEYDDWFFSHTPLPSSNDVEEIFNHWQMTAAIVDKEVASVIEKVLSKWDLPKRYAPALYELVMFNRIIPAPSGAKRTLTWRKEMGHWRRIEGEEYDIDTTVEERTELMKKDVFGLYKHRAKYLSGKIKGSPRDLAVTQQLIERYNKLKKEGRKGGKTDKQIFQLLKKDFTELSERAIQKRIKGY